MTSRVRGGGLRASGGEVGNDDFPLGPRLGHRCHTCPLAKPSRFRVANDTLCSAKVTSHIGDTRRRTASSASSGLSAVRTPQDRIPAATLRKGGFLAHRSPWRERRWTEGPGRRRRRRRGLKDIAGRPVRIFGCREDPWFVLEGLRGEEKHRRARPPREGNRAEAPIIVGREEFLGAAGGGGRRYGAGGGWLDGSHKQRRRQVLHRRRS